MALTQEQLEKHNKSITGSKVASILGLHPQRSKWQLFCEMHGDVEPKQLQGINLRMGTYAEKSFDEFIKNEYQWEIKEIPEGIEHPDYPFLWGLPDRICQIDGIWHILEYKNFDKFYKKEWLDENNNLVIPDYIQCQIYFYIALANMPGKLFAVFGGNDPQLFDIPRNPQIEKFIIEECIKFWDDLKNGHYPIPDGSDSCTETLKRIFPMSTENMIEGDTEIYELIKQREVLHEQMTIMEKQKQEIDNKLRLIIGDNAGITFGPNEYVSNKTTRPKTKKLDEKKLGEEMPEIYNKYLYLPEGYRRLYFKIKKEVN